MRKMLKEEDTLQKCQLNLQHLLFQEPVFTKQDALCDSQFSWTEWHDEAQLSLVNTRHGGLKNVNELKKIMKNEEVLKHDSNK
ncbi:hypothetical protein [Listeria booriae]|uniref:hypothetical protein n=1 Tax=Listeria booriae TaxID=1552123 RepID=UPI00162A328C|nr:hypothetical protein [Listeria booriae]MBC1248120.1 hypothetical protein [Listeria booriae]MBC1287308.1 hypothetical protein [Listeria booriae]